MLSAYLTESLIDEIERVQQTIGYTDFLNEIRRVSNDQKQLKGEAVGIYDTMINTLN
jgi:hypothetical protein